MAWNNSIEQFLPAVFPLSQISSPDTITASTRINQGSHWHWRYIVSGVCVWQAANILWKYWWKAPSNIPISAYPTPIGRWLTALQMMYDSERLLKVAYDSSNRKSFAIPMTDRWVVFVSDPDQLKMLDSEPETVLSMEEALHELALTSPILGHLQVPPEHKGPKSEAFRVMVGVLKNKLRANIPELSDRFWKRIKHATELEVGTLNEVDEEKHAWRKVRVMPALLRIFTRVNLMVFVGEEHADSVGVYQDVMIFFFSCVKAFPILGTVPSFLLPYIGPVAMGWGKTRQKVYSLFLLLTHQAIDGEKSIDGKPATSENITQWTAEMTRSKDALTIAKITFGLLFASAFQVPMVAQFCIHSICKHSEYHERLRAEAIQCKDTSFSSMNQEMPFLDSFVKETARLTPGIILSAPRTVMVPFTSAEGYHVPTGNWLAIPQVSLMRDEQIWPRASSFEGFRFVDGNGISKSRLTHPSYDFPFWGSIRHACPARFYVSVVMKMILSYLIAEYEFKLVDPDGAPFLTFGMIRLPNPFMSILVRRRAA